jgi:hypothetical protein
MSILADGTQELHSYLFEVRDLIADNTTNLDAIKSALVKLLVYLCSLEGRTSDNCTTTDTFFQLHADYSFNWLHLPKELQLILEDIGGQLHDTLEHPDVATNFESTPEQLLSRIHSLSF